MTLPVYISRDELHELEVPATYEAEGSFDVELTNYGESLHVHLHLDDALSEIATIEASNHYVEGESSRRVTVGVDTDRIEETHRGKLKVASAHGARTRWIDIELTRPEPETRSVQVDESLAKPQPTPTQESEKLDGSAAAVLGLGALAVVIAAGSALLLQEAVVALGALAVFGGVAVALFFLLREE